MGAERERAQERDRARGKGILGLIFAGYVLLASRTLQTQLFISVSSHQKFIVG